MNNLSDYKYPEFNEDFEGMIPQSGGGGGGGNVLTLYCRDEGEGAEARTMAYKDENFTQPFSSFEDAETTLTSATGIRAITWNDLRQKYNSTMYFAVSCEAEQDEDIGMSYASVAFLDSGDYMVVYLWFSQEDPEPDPGLDIN